MIVYSFISIGVYASLIYLKVGEKLKKKFDGAALVDYHKD